MKESCKVIDMIVYKDQVKSMPDHSFRETDSGGFTNSAFMFMTHPNVRAGLRGGSHGEPSRRKTR
jgi:hypothetical protein